MLHKGQAARDRHAPGAARRARHLLQAVRAAVREAAGRQVDPRASGRSRPICWATVQVRLAVQHGPRRDGERYSGRPQGALVYKHAIPGETQDRAIPEGTMPFRRWPCVLKLLVVSVCCWRRPRPCRLFAAGGAGRRAGRDAAAGRRRRSASSRSGRRDPNFKPDYSKLPPELQKTFAYIDEHIDEHVENLRSGSSSRASPTAAKAFRKAPRW